MNGPFRLRNLGIGARLGVACLVLTMLGGFAASLAYVVMHHGPKDDQPGVSMNDLKGTYHGVQITAPMLGALERGHPEDLPADQRDTLAKWLRGERISEDFDNLDLGDTAPIEILATSCLSCHSRQNASARGGAIPLEYWDDVRKVAFSKQLDPVHLKILTVSTHTHALSLGSLTVVVAGLLLATSWPRRAVNLAIFVAGAALFLDLGAWWLARFDVRATYLVAGGGAAYSGAMILMLLAVLLDLVLPRQAAAVS